MYPPWRQKTFRRLDYVSVMETGFCIRHGDTKHSGDWILPPSSGGNYSVGSNRERSEVCLISCISKMFVPCRTQTYITETRPIRPSCGPLGTESDEHGLTTRLRRLSI
jgi:hypothetical protein